MAGPTVGGPWGTAGAGEDVPKLHYFVLAGYNGRAGTLYVKNTKGQEFEMSPAEFMAQGNFSNPQ